MNPSEENRLPVEFPPLPPDLRQPPLRIWLRYFGPGAIMACVTIASGETVFASRNGAIFGYSLMWCFAIGALMKGLQVYSASRFITLTGRHPLDSWLELPGRGAFVWFVAVMSIFWMPFFIGGGLPRMLGDFTNWVVGFPDPQDAKQYVFYGRVWGTLFTVVAVLITWLQTYGFLEKIQTAMVALLVLCMLIAAILSNPDWVALLQGMVVPSPVEYQPWVLSEYPLFANRHPWVETLVCISIIGGGTQDYIGYIGMLREKGCGMMGRVANGPDTPSRNLSRSPENLSRGRAWLRAPLIDVVVSFIMILVFTVSFSVLGAAVLNPQKVIPEGFELLTIQAGYLVRPGQSDLVQFLLGWVYKTGIFFAFFGTIYGAYELYTRTTHECVVAIMPRFRHVSMRKFRLFTIVWNAGAGLCLLWLTTKDPVKLVTPAALVVAGIVSGLWCFAMLWSDRAHVPRELQMKWPLRVGLVISGVFLTVGPLLALIRFVQDTF